jgi:hypothetical protein
MASYLNLRIPTELGERMKPHAAAIGYTDNKFASECIAAILDLIDYVDARNVPRIVVQVDAVRRAEAHPERLGPMGVNEVVRSDLRRRNLPTDESEEECPISENLVQTVPETASGSGRSGSNRSAPAPAAATTEEDAKGNPRARSTAGVRKMARKAAPHG